MQCKLLVVSAAIAVLGACAHQQARPSSQSAGEPLSGPSPAAPSPPASSPPASSTPAPAPAVQSAPPSSPSTRAASRTPSKKPAAAPGAPPGSTSTPSRSASAQPTLDLKTLEQRLRDTNAIGVFTKLSLKNQVDDLLADIRAFHGGRPNPPLSELRQSYESLLLKVVTVLQNGDPQLASAVSSSRDSIWALLSDPRKFAEIS